jgi:hypothetical protein
MNILLHNPDNPLIGGIGAQTNNRSEPPCKTLWNVLFYKNAAFGDKCRNIFNRKQGFCEKNYFFKKNCEFEQI